MSQFFEIDGIVDVLSIVAFILTLIMFVPWLRDNREKTKTLLSVNNLSYLFLIIGLYLLFTGKGALSLISYVLWWSCSVYVFFSKIETSKKHLKQSFFTLMLNTCLIFSVFQLYVLTEVIELFGGVSDNQAEILKGQKTNTRLIGKIVDNQKKITDKLANELPNKPIKQD